MDHKNKSKNTIERRTNERHAVANGIVALPKASGVSIGTVLDISKSGLGVRYAETEGFTHKMFNIDILLNDSNYYLTEIPVEAVSDNELDNVIPFSLINERRCSLKFRKLTEAQAEMLDTLFAQKK